MVGVFASLKWQLVGSRIRAARGGAKAGMVIAFILVAILLGFATVGLALLRSVPQAATPVIITVFTLQLVAWMLAPLVAFGVDETVDPARFALLPLRLPTLQRGLLVASLIGYFPVGNMVLLLGAAIAVGVPWSVFPIAVICAIVQLLTCVVLSRASSTSMSALMSSRRGRDLGMGVGLLIFLLYMGFVAFINNPGDGNALESGVNSVASILQWTPPGALASLPALVAAGEWGHAAIAAIIGLGALALAWWWWSRALDKSLTTVPSTTEGSAPAGHGSQTAIGGGVVGTMKVVVGRDRLLTWRDPMRRMPWLMLAVLTVVWPFLVVRGHGSVFAVTFGAIFCGAQAGNQYGMEGSGLWLHLQTITDRARARGEMLGHAVTALIPGIVIVVVAIAVLAVAKDDLEMVPAALGVCLAALFGAIAAASYVSAVLPYAMPQSRKSLFASSVPGQKGRTFGASLSFIGGGLLVTIPAAICAVLSLTVSPVWGWIGLVVGPVTGVIALVVSANLTSKRFLEQATEIFAVVSAGDRA